MTTFLILLLILAIVATVVMLVRGLIVFLKTTEADLKQGGTGPSQSALKQNRMMFGRIKFQGLAIIIVILIIVLARQG